MDETRMDGDVVGNGLTFSKLIAWTVLLFKSPRRFFSSMEKSGGYGTPVLFALFWFFTATLLELIISHLRPQPVQFGWAVELVWLLAGPALFLGMGFVAAAIFFVIWHLMGSQQNYQTAFRCWAFTTPLAVVSAILGIVPYLNVLGLLFGIYLLVIASVETHGIAAKRSWKVWGSICAGLIVLLAASEVARRYLQRQGMGLNAPGGYSDMINDEDEIDEDLGPLATDEMAEPLSVSTSSAVSMGEPDAKAKSKK